MEAIGQQLLAMDPSSRAFRLLAEVKYNQGDYADALDLNNQALELAETDEERRDLHYNLGLTYYEMGRLPQARASADRSIRLDPTFGMGDVLLGDIYVRAVQGSSFERKDKAVYWLAVDHYRRAIQRDPNLQPMANQKIGQYTRFFPDQEEKFFEGWTNGQEYEVNYGQY